MDERILVTTATGTVGREVVAALRAHGISIRIGMRDRSKAQPLGFDDLEVVEFDFRKTYTYEAALADVRRLFVLMPPGQPGIYRDVQRFIDAAQQADVAYVVYMSGMGVDRRPAEPMRHIERHIMDSDLPYTFLRPNWFMQNYNSWLAPMITAGELRLPFNGGRISLVDTRDIAAVAAHLLTADNVPIKNEDNSAYVLTGPTALDHDTVAQMLSDAIGQTIRYVSTSVEANLEELRGQSLSDEEIDTMRWLYADVHVGYTATVTSSVEDLTGQKPRTFAAYVQEFQHLWAQSS